MKCEECGAIIIGSVCRECGLVIETHPIVSFPERDYDRDKGIGSVITTNAPDLKYMTTHSSKTRNPELKRAFRREAMFKNGNPIEYRLIVEILRIVSALQLPDFIGLEAQNIFNSVLKKNPDYFKTKYFQYAAVAAYVVIAAKINNYPIQLKDVYEFSSEKPKNIRNAYMDAIELLKFDVNMKLEVYINDAISKCLKDEEKRQTLSEKILKIAQFLDKNINISGKKPLGYIGALIYIYGKPLYRIKLKQISSKLKLTQPTIRSRVNEIKKIIKKVKKK